MHPGAIVSKPSVHWLSLEDYLASGERDRPVFLVLDTSPYQGKDHRTLWGLLDSPGIRNAIATRFVAVHDHSDLYPEVMNLLRA
ncbi:MAG: hypothetical protein JXR94_04265, partial [Candidatus Hydrogenedentes bacterium]|nr:hypothetical protein [Candidatus Hydrogenedentota bacterium]